jgi:hypothetical protein
VEAWQSDGHTIAKLAAELSDAAKLEPPLSPDHISRWLRNQYGGEAVKARLTLARRHFGSHALVEQALATADAVTNKDAAVLAKLQNDLRLWIAERWNRDDYGTARGGVNLQLNIGQLHLDAMRQRNIRETLELPAMAIVDNGLDK